MSDIFQEFKFIQGYIGGYIFRPETGIVIKDMPTVYKDDKLKELGDVLIKTYKSGSLNFSDMIDVSICFQEAVIIIREASNNTFVFLLIDPSANINLFNMTLSVLMDDIAKLDPSSAAKAAPPKPVEPEKKPEPAASGPKISGTEILSDGPMAEILQNMQKALADITGPIAKVIMVDAIELWAGNHTPDEDSLPALAEIIYKEINDPDNVEVFKKKISPILESSL